MCVVAGTYPLLARVRMVCAARRMSRLLQPHQSPQRVRVMAGLVWMFVRDLRMYRHQEPAHMACVVSRMCLRRQHADRSRVTYV